MGFTNLAYAEFDTTVQNLIPDLIAKIVASASWAKISSTSVLATTNASSAANATTLTFASGVPAASFTLGQVIRIGAYGSDHEYRTITAIAATTITVANLTYAHASGTNIYVGNEVLKATTTEGADMILDLMDSHVRVVDNFLAMAAYRTHTGAYNGGVDKQQRWLYFKSNANAAATQAVHAIVSVSKDHLYIQLEGPRPTEVGPDSTIWGSWRQYFFMSSMLSYFSGDATPCVYVGGNTSAQQAIVNWAVSGVGHLTKNYAGTAVWDGAKLASIATPTISTSAGVHHTRVCAADGNYYLFPYVVISDNDGLRGRLKCFFFAGFAASVESTDLAKPPAVGSRISFEGQDYILIIPSKTSYNAISAGQFGANGNANGDNRYNVVIAVPVV